MIKISATGFIVLMMFHAIGCADDTRDADGSDVGGGDGVPSGGSGDGDADSDADGDVPPEPSDGCSGAGLESGSQTLTVDGTERTFLLDLPASYDGTTPHPIIFGFHGMGTSGDMFRSQYYGDLLSAMADEVIVVHPDAIGDPTAWDTAVDVPFFDALLEHLASSLCVDEARVFATGHSSGGFFTNSLGCERGDVLRGIAPVSGGGPFVFGGTACVGQVAAWIAHAENDETVDFSNGESSRDHWLETNGCDGTSSTAVTPDGCVSYSGCDAGYPVHWCVYQDGHDWPAFAPEGMWNFFKAL